MCAHLGHVLVHVGLQRRQVGLWTGAGRLPTVTTLLHREHPPLSCKAQRARSARCAVRRPQTAALLHPLRLGPALSAPGKHFGAKQTLWCKGDQVTQLAATLALAKDPGLPAGPDRHTHPTHFLQSRTVHALEPPGPDPARLAFIHSHLECKTASCPASPVALQALTLKGLATTAHGPPQPAALAAHARLPAGPGRHTPPSPCPSTLEPPGPGPTQTPPSIVHTSIRCSYLDDREGLGVLPGIARGLEGLDCASHLRRVRGGSGLGHHDWPADPCD
jgi:hypothetical protein